MEPRRGDDEEEMLNKINSLSSEANAIKTRSLSRQTHISFSDIPSQNLAVGNKNKDAYKRNYEQTTTVEYRQKKAYPSSEVDSRPKVPNYENFCMHGTQFDSILPALVSSNLQMVPGLKLRKLTGKGSDAGESMGTTEFNQKRVSAVSWSSTIALPFAYSMTIFKAKDNLGKPRIPVVVLGDGAGEVLSHGRDFNGDEEVSYKRINIRLFATTNPSDKAVILGVLRKLEIYDIKVCTLNELVDLEYSPKN